MNDKAGKDGNRNCDGCPKIIAKTQFLQFFMDHLHKQETLSHQRTTFIIAVNAAIIGLVAGGLTKSVGASSYLLFSIFCSSGAVAIALLSVFPWAAFGVVARPRSDPRDVFYYRGIVGFENAAEYVQAIEGLDYNQIEGHCSAQIYGKAKFVQFRLFVGGLALILTIASILALSVLASRGL